MNPVPNCVVFAFSGFLPRNRLAGMHVLPSGSSICAWFWFLLA